MGSLPIEAFDDEPHIHTETLAIKEKAIIMQVNLESQRMTLMVMLMCCSQVSFKFDNRLYVMRGISMPISAYIENHFKYDRNLLCKNGHPLKLQSELEMYQCGYCLKNLSNMAQVETYFTCDQCEFHMCQGCATRNREIIVKPAEIWDVEYYKEGKRVDMSLQL